ncbi:MAG: DEAD/DEAH box helicase [Acidimicrobiales bacterium]
MSDRPLHERVPDAAGSDQVLLAFLEWAADRGLELYPHQEEAILALLAGEHVVLSTPTGSGKSLVALAGAFAMRSAGRRTVYTAPIKALVSEKFFELATELGADNVGMVTGDASVNGDAPVIVCTAEILANRALREGPTPTSTWWSWTSSTTTAIATAAGRGRCRCSSSTTPSSS